MLTKISVEKIEARRTAQKTSDAAVEMHEIQDPPLPRDDRCLAEILEVDEVNPEASGFVVFDHNVGLLQIVGVEPCLVKPPHFLRDGIGNAFAAANVAAFDLVGAEYEAAERIGARKRAAKNIRGTNRAEPVRI